MPQHRPFALFPDASRPAQKRRRRLGSGATLEVRCNFDHLRRRSPGCPLASAGAVGRILQPVLFEETDDEALVALAPDLALSKSVRS
jgi:hypothetical protein